MTSEEQFEFLGLKSKRDYAEIYLRRLLDKTVIILRSSAEQKPINYKRFFYMGFCDLCGFLDADLNRDVLFDSLLEHQLKKHPEHQHVYRETIIIFKVEKPYAEWLIARRSPKFWKAWRNRQKPSHVAQFLKTLKALKSP